MVGGVRIKEITNRFRTPGGNQERGLLELIEKLPQDRKLTMIEIGSAFGESARVFWDTGRFEKIYCIDPWNDNKDREFNFDTRTSNIPEIIKIKEKAENVTHLFPDHSIDFVYIDACHDYDSVKKDIVNYLPKIKKQGFVGGHDYSHSFLGVIKAVFEYFTFPDYVFRDSSWLVQLK